MSSIGHARHHAKPRKSWLSGFCGLDLPADSHERCRGAYEGAPCGCSCHKPSDAGAPTTHPDSVVGADGESGQPAAPGPEINLHILPDLEQGSEEWHDQRRGMVTASVVGKLLTPTLKVADNDTSRGLVATLTAERITGYTEPSFMNDDMVRGVMHEPVARDRYAEVNSVTVTNVGFMVRTVDGGHEIGYSPDGLVGDDGLLEVKCPRAKTHIRTIAADQVPAHYMPQCQTGLFVSGRQWIDFVSFCAGLPMWTKRVLPDPKWQEVIVAAVAAFEKASDELATEYLTRAADLPATERIPDDLGLVF